MHNKISRIINYTATIAILLAVIFYISLKEFKYQGKDKNELSNFPLIAQPDNITCGVASISMVLKYYGKEVSINDIRKRAKTDIWTKGNKKIGGTQPIFVKIALNHYDVPSNIEYGNLDKLKYYIDQGKPVIVLVRSGFLLMHYIVVIGYTQTEIIVANPSNGGSKHSIDNNVFKKCWNFRTDMDGVDPFIQCMACKGKGYIGIKIIGKCDLCAGTGKIDPMASILKIVEIHENTMIVKN
jgi:uncharacterized protein YvpB